MDQTTARKIISQTKADYNAMAAQFSMTRASLPADILALKTYISRGEKILDLGCGNGRFSELFDRDDYIGADISDGLVEIARQKYPEKKFLVVDALSLPFPDKTFDKIFCLAVIHHLPSTALRRSFLAEIKRVMKPDGTLVLTSWYLLHKPKMWRLLIYATWGRTLRRSRLDLGDFFLPFLDNQGKVLANRYLHAFSLRGLTHLVAGQDFKIKSAGLVERGRNKNIQIVALG